MKPYYQDEQVTIYHGDCREIELSPSVLITDPPYGITDHKWDIVVAPDEWMSQETCITFASEPFATDLINTAPLSFRYDLVWSKNTASNHLNAARRPLRQHERVLVFGAADYHPVKVPRSALEMARLNKAQRERHPDKFPGSVLDFAAVNNRSGERTKHPSQKPVALLLWLVASYSLPGETILDPFMGSGTTLVAARELGRKAIGIELEERYCEIAAERCAQEVLDLAA